MKTIMPIIFLLLTVSDFAINKYSCLFLDIEPSSLNCALGEITGVANIWHNDALLSYSNPALPALSEGVRYGFTDNPWLKGSGFEDIYYKSAFWNVNRDGFAVTLPDFFQARPHGVLINYGPEIVTNEHNENIAVAHPYNKAGVYGVAFELPAIFNLIDDNYTFSDKFHLAAGINYFDILSNFDLQYIGNGELHKIKGEAHSWNWGIVTSGKYNLDRFLEFEAACGYADFNFTKEEIKYTLSEQSDIISRHGTIGAALSASIPVSFLKLPPNLKPFLFCDKLLTMTYLVGNMDTFSDDANIKGNGMELGFFDTVFVRNGYYKDEDCPKVGGTHGWGINLHYKNLFSYSYNYSSVPGGNLVNRQTAHDHNFMLNLQEIGKLALSNL